MEATAKPDSVAEEQGPRRPNDADGSAALTNVEGAIREFVRRDVTSRKFGSVDSAGQSVQASPSIHNSHGSHNSQGSHAGHGSHAAAPAMLDTDGIERFVQRTGGASVKEIDNLITELHAVREFLVAEGERVQREIAHYTQTSKAALSSARIILDSMGQWKSAAGAPRNPRG